MRSPRRVTFVDARRRARRRPGTTKGTVLTRTVPPAKPTTGPERQRPPATTLPADVVAILFEHLRSGTTIKDAAAAAGTDYSTVYKSAQRDTAFKSRLDAARAEGRYRRTPILNADVQDRIINLLRVGLSVQKAAIAVGHYPAQVHKLAQQSLRFRARMEEARTAAASRATVTLTALADPDTVTVVDAGTAAFLRANPDVADRIMQVLVAGGTLAEACKAARITPAQLDEARNADSVLHAPLQAAE
ncbi:hypothetical protein [Glycomyces sp. YM15]|uniref:hypothetical protein n=1 Tax=Glycomyces sp. YM15 TaxID=2800446 RepID=UPI0019653FC7|nr:hypothetical protein [Glycomyces sp. YM15]